jgi:hypothetical protein
MTTQAVVISAMTTKQNYPWYGKWASNDSGFPKPPLRPHTLCPTAYWQRHLRPFNFCRFLLVAFGNLRKYEGKAKQRQLLRKDSNVLVRGLVLTRIWLPIIPSEQYLVWFKKKKLVWFWKRTFFFPWFSTFHKLPTTTTKKRNPWPNLVDIQA